MGSCVCVDKCNKDDNVNKRLMSGSMSIPKYEDLTSIPTNNKDWKVYIDSVLEDNMSMGRYHEHKQWDKSLDIDMEQENMKYQAAISA
mmetsp:Transcript_59900/g.53905  ORF Transcript_59900/g.53905 Transcript_59900/m.53905 type:complete len:88 (+) Transcript_59900:36-299(+)